MNRDFGEIIKENPQRLRILEIRAASMGYLTLRLTIFVSDYPKREFSVLEILCRNAVDYIIKPPNPGILEGGPLIELHEQHKLLNDPGLQCKPNQDDGEKFNPPLQLKVLILDQSYVIAERFEIAERTEPILH